MATTAHPWNVARQISSRLLDDVPPSDVKQSVAHWPFNTLEEADTLRDEYQSADDAEHALSEVICDRLSQNGLSGYQPPEAQGLSEWNTAQTVAATLLGANDPRDIVDNIEYTLPPIDDELTEFIEEATQAANVHEQRRQLARCLMEWAQSNGEEDNVATSEGETRETESERTGSSGSQGEYSDDRSKLAHQLLAEYLSSSQSPSGFEPQAAVAEYTGFQLGRAEIRQAVINAPGSTVDEKAESLADALHNWKNSSELGTSRTMMTGYSSP